MLKGYNFIGYEKSGAGNHTIQVFSTLEKKYLADTFFVATDDEINATIAKAKSAFKLMKQIPDENRALFLETIALEIERTAEENIEMAVLESGLPIGRLQGETGRTVGQLRLFAKIVREGTYMQSIIDTADSQRSPLPKPGLRTRSLPLGPVVVFAASNFPFAFSTAGGDTASALAAGCPVILKAHPSHLGTNNLITECIIRAAKKCDMPDGIFSSLNGEGAELGIKLVKHPDVKAVGFTGSRKAGMALVKTASEREVPIPVYAEMSSVNPVVILPELLSAKAKETAEKLAGSICLGAGQFCTNPGLIFLIKDNYTSEFIQSLKAALQNIAPQVMLNKDISENYYHLIDALNKNAHTQAIVNLKDTKSEFKAVPSLFQVSAKDFIIDKSLQQEVFGPTSLLVICENKQELISAIESTEGQLTATILATDHELPSHLDILDSLTEKAGRIIFNNMPTGVEVSYAMIHGGPYPATSDGRTTSVGGEAIKRFLRPVCFQDFPNSVLPEGLKNTNPNEMIRKVDGVYTSKNL